MIRVEVYNNPRCERHYVEFANTKEAFEYIHEKILSDDQAADWFEAQDWGDPYELALEQFEKEFGCSICMGDYTYSLIDEDEENKK